MHTPGVTSGKGLLSLLSLDLLYHLILPTMTLIIYYLQPGHGFGSDRTGCFFKLGAGYIIPVFQSENPSSPEMIKPMRLVC
jgi:hypothetical protein